MNLYLKKIKYQNQEKENLLQVETMIQNKKIKKQRNKFLIKNKIKKKKRKMKMKMKKVKS